MKVMLVGNSDSLPEPIGTGGMERSFATFVELLTHITKVDRGIDFVAPQFLDRADWSDAPHLQRLKAEYLNKGDGIGKWEHIQNDSRIYCAIESAGAEVDIIHDQSSSIIPSLVAEKYGKPIIRTCRLPFFHPSAALTASKAASIVCLSRFQTQLVPEQFSTKTHVIRDFIASPPAILPSKRVDRLISVGRIESRKGIEAAARYALEKDLPIDFVGPIVDTKIVDDINKRLGPLATFHGALLRNATLQMISQAKALVWMPNFPEPGGRVVLEALHCLTPVIATPIGYAFDILHYMFTDERRKQSLQSIHHVGNFHIYPQDVNSRWITEEEYVSSYLRLYASYARV